MSRPSGNADVKLILSAQELLDEKGFTGLKIREVAKKAGVNLGMFHYHFKSKKKFERRVLQDLYERFFADFKLESSSSGTSLERLRRAMVAASRFVRDQRRLILGAMMDASHGDSEILSFAASNFPRHVLIVFGLIQECQKKGYIDRMPLHLAVSVLLPPIVAPNVAMAIVERKNVPFVVRTVVKGVLSDVLSDATMKRRVDLALRAVGAKSHPRRAS